MTYQYKYPIILPKNSHFGDLMIHEAHLAVGHQGSQAVLHHICQQYWVVGAKVTVNRVVHQCLDCKWYKARLGEQLMASLPRERVNADCSIF